MLNTMKHNKVVCLVENGSILLRINVLVLKSGLVLTVLGSVTWGIAGR